MTTGPLTVEPAHWATPGAIRLFTAMRSAAEALIPGSHSNAMSVLIVPDAEMPETTAASFSLAHTTRVPTIGRFQLKRAGQVVSINGVVRIRESAARTLLSALGPARPNDPEYVARIGALRTAAWPTLHEFIHSLTTLPDGDRVKDWTIGHDDPGLTLIHEGATDLLTEMALNRWLDSCGLSAGHPMLSDGTVPLNVVTVANETVATRVLGNGAERSYLRRVVGTLRNSPMNLGQWTATMIAGRHAEARHILAHAVAANGQVDDEHHHAATRISAAIDRGLSTAVAEARGVAPTAITAALGVVPIPAPTPEPKASALRRVNLQCALDRAVDGELRREFDRAALKGLAVVTAEVRAIRSERGL